MGSGYGYGDIDNKRTRPPVPLHDQTPVSPRQHLAGPLVKALLAVVAERVLQPREHPNSVRECYEVSWALRGCQDRFERVVREHIQGSYLGDSMSLDRKIAMMFITYVDAVLIRPGPTPEDRQCSDMVVESQQLVTGLTQFITNIIKVDDAERGLV